MVNLLLSLLLSVLVPLGIVILLLLFTFKQVYSYWDNFDIPVIPPQIPYGSLGNPLTKNVPFYVKVAEAYKKFKEDNQKHGGIYIYLIPYYIPVDPVIIRNILIKNFNCFSERSMYSNRKKDPLSVNLLTVEGQEWRDMRTKLTPLFSIHKIKKMFPLLQIHSNKLVEKINDCVNRMEPVKLHDFMGRFIIDGIGSCSFGVECNSLENPHCRFIKIKKTAFRFTQFRFLKANFTRSFPNLARFIGMITFSNEFTEYIIKLVDESIAYRTKNGVKRDDLFQSLMELEKNETDASIKKAKISAQSLMFFNAGTESSSTTATFAIYELACNPEIQDKLREEVISVLKSHNRTITYEALMEMEYLSKVVDETLRKYPPTPAIPRKCVQDCPVEGTDLVIKKGGTLFISIWAVHRDPEYYPNPEVFDPERFNEANKSKRPACTFIPFIDGPRNCIGQKLGLLQIKLGLVSLLKNFKFSVNPKTEIPTLDTETFICRFSNDVYIDFEKIS